MDVKIKLLDDGAMPVFKHAQDACADAKASLSSESITIPPHSRCLVGLGFACELPDGYELQVRPRSGLSSKGIDVAFGTGDSNYRGEYKACVINNTDNSYEIKDGDRIAQIAIRPIPQIHFERVEELSDTDRGESGFGSTGLN